MKLEEMKEKICHKSIGGTQTHCLGELCMACRMGVYPEYHCADAFRSK